MMKKSPYIPPKDWTPEQVQAKLQNLIDHVERLKDHWRDDDLHGLINVHGIFSPELARAALEKEVYLLGTVALKEKLMCGKERNGRRHHCHFFLFQIDGLSVGYTAIVFSKKLF